MSTTRNQLTAQIISMEDPGVSFSVKNCREYGVEWRDALKFGLMLGFRRFRLMSYWDEYERLQGTIDFSELHEQIKIIEQAGGMVTMCVGMRQPRWPETHIPAWAKSLPNAEAELVSFKFLEATVTALKDEESVISWQLENEFWLRSFGEHFDFSRRRLKAEFQLVRKLDPDRPIIMSLANTLSLPLRSPKADIYATSMYRNLYDKGTYRKTHFAPWYYRLRRIALRLLRNRDLIIHELQTEPWGPRANWEMDDLEQFKSMNVEEVKVAIHYAQKTGIKYMDLWGLEWWYWRVATRGDTDLQPILASIHGHDTVA